MTKDRDPALLHPLEAVDAALANDKFRALVEAALIGERTEERIFFDSGRDVWFVGVACGARACRPAGGPMLATPQARVSIGSRFGADAART